MPRKDVALTQPCITLGYTVQKLVLRYSSYSSYSSSVTIQATPNMECLKAEEPLARAKTEDNRNVFHCFSDWTVPPQFDQVSYERFGQDRFEALSEELNNIIKEEY